MKKEDVMRGTLEYLSDVKGDCADDINLDLISSDIEKKFVSWTKVLEDTVSHLNQSLKYYKVISRKHWSKSKLFSEYNCFFSNYMYTLCVAMTMDIGKLCSDENDLSLNKYNKFCFDNATTIFKRNIDGLYVNNQKNISKLIKNYKDLIMTPRNKIYGHNGSMQLETSSVDEAVDRVSISNLIQFASLSKSVLFETWKVYNNHSLCFEYKDSEDFKRLIDLIENS